jgi:hypothetical protein
MNKILNFKVLSTLIPILLCIVAVLIYSANINGDFVFDDPTYLVNNSVITTISPFDFSTLFLTNTNAWGEVLPFRDFIFVLQYKAFGDWTTGYHIFSLFLFICSYFIVFKLVYTLTKDHLTLNEQDNNKTVYIITLLVTSFFLFHPINIECFNYISGQKDALSFLFILLSIFFVYKSGRVEHQMYLFLLLGVFFHYIAILSKISALPSILFFPILLLLTSNRSQKNKILLICIWFLANIPVVFWFFHTMALVTSKQDLVAATPFIERVPRAFNYLGMQISHVLKPWPLNMGYPVSLQWRLDSYFVLGFLFMGIFSLVAVIKRNTFTIIGFFIFILYLATTLHIFPDIPNDKVYDRYMVVPFIGILISLIPVTLCSSI